MSEKLNKESDVTVSDAVNTDIIEKSKPQEVKKISPEQFLKDFNWHNY